jgi:hypothetical protein
MDHPTRLPSALYNRIDTALAAASTWSSAASAVISDGGPPLVDEI